jgi:hypothetical protein
MPLLGRGREKGCVVRGARECWSWSWSNLCNNLIWIDDGDGDGDAMEGR